MWSTLTELSVKLVGPITNAVLARLLVPESFGVVASLTMVVSFAEVFTDAGFQKYLVQHEFGDDEDLNLSTNVAFWTNLCFSLLFWVAISLFAEPIAKLAGSPGCGTAVIVMSLQIPILAFSSIQMARFRRDMDFRGLFVVRMITAFVPLAVTVPLALIFRSYWALVIGTLSRDVLTAVILTCRSRWKPRLRYRFAKLKEMLSFSIWSLVENVSIWMTNYVGTFIVGLALTEYYLGLYKTTMTTVNGCLNVIATASMQVLFAGLSRCQDDEEQTRSIFFRFQRMLALLMIPLGCGLYLYRGLATDILLGSQWTETADFLGLWALTSSLTIVFGNVNSELYRSKGKPRLSVLSQVLHLVVLIPVLILLMHQGYGVLTTFRSLIRLQTILVTMTVSHLLLGIKVGSVLRNVYPSLIAAVVMSLSGWLLQQLWSGILWQMVSIGLCVLIYGGCLLLLPKGRRQLLEVPVLRKILKKIGIH